MLPRYLIHAKTFVPPIVQQGSKNKLLPFLFQNIAWNGKGTFYEPFCGGCVFLFNLQPKIAVVSDTNPYLIQFYQDIQQHRIEIDTLRAFLQDSKKKLLIGKDAYYYEMRDKFNADPNSLTFFFLITTCRRNLMRFNSNWKFNSPFLFTDHDNLMNINDPQGLYIERTLKKIKEIQTYLNSAHVEFYHRDFQASLQDNKPDDLVYLDPPYIFKASYGVDFTEQQMQYLADWTKATSSYYAISNWLSDGKRINPTISWFNHCIVRSIDYTYFIGTGKSDNADENIDVKECLIMNTKTDAQTKASITNFFPNKIKN